MRRLPAALAWLIVLAPPVAFAEPDGEEQYRQAMKSYEAGDYTRAARAFARAYRREKVPRYLFGWAQSERLRGRCKVALPLYEEFLSLAPSPQDVVVTRAAMKRCDQWLPEDERAPERMAQSQRESGPEAEPGPRRTNLSLSTRAKPAPRERPSAFRWAIGSRVDVDPLHRGAVVAPCLGFGVSFFEAFGNALLGANQGLEAGARVAARGKRWSPFLSASAPLFFIAGPRPGVRGSVGMRLWLGSGWALTAEAGGAAMANPPPGLARGAGLVSLAVEIWN